MTTQHTLGPWCVDENSSGDTGLWGADGKMIAIFPKRNEYENLASDKQQTANVGLIADAPETAAELERVKVLNEEMSQTLRDILADIVSDEIETNEETRQLVIDNIRAILAKVIGE